MAVYPAEKVKNRRPSAGEQVVSSLVMALLVCIAVSLLVVQSRYSRMNGAPLRAAATPPGRS